jgi:ribosomal protein S18 acetylase RimI-like enzyme
MALSSKRAGRAMFASGAQNGVSWFKRFRMELDLQAPLPPPTLPPEFSWQAWRDELLEAHALVKYHSFEGELDGVIFPNLGCQDGCLRLMRDIRGRPGFRPEGTWLIVRGDAPCGTIQSVREQVGCGAIQNIGVTPAQRGRGLGTALLLKALWGLRTAGHHRVTLEVTAGNDAAVRLYRRLGFRRRRTLYKAVDAVAAVAAAGGADSEWYL